MSAFFFHSLPAPLFSFLGGGEHFITLITDRVMTGIQLWMTALELCTPTQHLILWECNKTASRSCNWVDSKPFKLPWFNFHVNRATACIYSTTSTYIHTCTLSMNVSIQCVVIYSYEYKSVNHLLLKTNHYFHKSRLWDQANVVKLLHSTSRTAFLSGCLSDWGHTKLTQLDCTYDHMVVGHT